MEEKYDGCRCNIAPVMMIVLVFNKAYFERVVGSAESCEKVPAKFGEGISVRADGLRIGCPGSVGSRKVGNSNMREFFCTTL